MKIKNIEKLEQAKQLLAEVFIEEHGVEMSPKFINFETISKARADALLAQNPNQRLENITFSVAHKYGYETASIKVFMIVDKNSSKIS